MSETLSQKLTTIFPGKNVRKDLLHRIKKGTNIPSFVLEFLLARYCASDDEDEIQGGLDAVLEVLQENYVRPSESDTAQSKVAVTKSHKFIDKVHVSFKEKEKRHWAEMENFGSKRIAIPEKYYKGQNRILEGGIWAEVRLGYNDVEEDKYTFYVEDLRPIQLSKFDWDEFVAGREQFTRDEWLDVVVRTIGLKPSKFSFKQKLHLMARMIPFAEKNYNLVELGPRGTGKSYVFSEFSPFSTLISGGQASSATLFYNNSKKAVGLVGYWDTIAFDEVGGVKIKDPNTITIMKDFMANGRFSRGADVIADASFAFIGNIDHSIKSLVNSERHDLFISLPPAFDLAVMDRFHFYLPGWEMPKNSSEYLTQEYGFITDYLAEAFHYQAKNVNRYEYVSRRSKFGKDFQGRDEAGVKKTMCGLIKLLHPGCEPTPEEFDEYMEYAIEGRRRVKEQMNKRKPDDEFASINLSFFDHEGNERVVFCPESKNAAATQTPVRGGLEDEVDEAKPTPEPKQKKEVSEELATQVAIAPQEIEEPKPKRFKVGYNQTGYSYESLFGPYLKGAEEVIIEDPYIRKKYQVNNFLRFCEMLVTHGQTRKITLITLFESKEEALLIEPLLQSIQSSLREHDIELDVKVDPHAHDREIRMSNDWAIDLGRGLDMYQVLDDWMEIGSTNYDLRPCKAFKVSIYRQSEGKPQDDEDE